MGAISECFIPLIWSYPHKNTISRYYYYVPHVNRWANWASHVLITVTCPRLHSVRSERWNQKTVLQNPGRNLVSALQPYGSKWDKTRLQSNGRSHSIFSTKLLPYLTYKNIYISLRSYYCWSKLRWKHFSLERL